MAEGAIGITFRLARIFQAACMVAVIGMTSNFVSQIVSVHITPPSILIGTLSIISIAVLYCVITFILYLDNLLPFIIAFVIDCLFLIALIVVSVVIGKPLSYLNCNAVDKLSKLGSAGSSIASAFGGSTGKINYGDLIEANKSTCLEMKSIWGLSIALCILFTLSATASICLWKRSKQTSSLSKGEA